MLIITLLLLTTFSRLITSISQDDARLLLSFRQTLDEHDSLRNWNLSTPLASWSGVIWNGTAAVELQLAGFGLQGKLNTNPFWCSLKSLRILNLTSNNLTGAPLSTKWCSPSLHSLWLSRNNLTGPLVEIRSNTLQELVLSYNSFHGPIPANFGDQLPALRDLYLGANQLTGRIPASLGRLARLEELSLGFNAHIEGEIPLSLSNCTKLRTLILGGNHLTGSLESLHFPSLQKLVLNRNDFHGRLPEHLCQTSPGLSGVYLSGNRLSGQLSRSLDNCTLLQDLSLHDNDFTGPIPEQLSALASLHSLDLSYNHLSGKFPVSILLNCTKLQYFSAAMNMKLNGSFPSVINSSNLVIMDFCSNELTGGLPSISSTQLGQLNFHDNLFPGGIPDSWATSLCRSIRLLQLGHNVLEGSIPSWLGNCTNLFVLELNSNSFNGVIPSELGYLPALSSKNYQSKIIGNCTVCPSIGFMIGNQTSSRNVNGLQSLLSLCDNNLTGSIPHELGNLQGLQLLELCNNSLSGAIPPSLSNMTSLEKMLLNNNHLSGSLPSSLASLTFLSKIDVSNNSLEGPIPSGTQISTFEPAWFSGNPGLCGPPIDQPCRTAAAPIVTVPSPDPISLALPIAAGAAFAFPVSFWIAFRFQSYGRLQYLLVPPKFV